MGAAHPVSWRELHQHQSMKGQDPGKTNLGLLPNLFSGGHMASNQAPGADDKAATLKLSLRADSGYSADTEYRISANQWGRIVAVAEDGEQYLKMVAAQDLLEALEKYVAAGHGNSTDHAKQGEAYDAAIEALAKATGGLHELRQVLPHPAA